MFTAMFEVFCTIGDEGQAGKAKPPFCGSPDIEAIRRRQQPKQSLNARHQPAID